MHFGGVIISDDMGAAAAVASLSPAARAISFLSAGGDMILSDSLPRPPPWTPRWRPR